MNDLNKLILVPFGIALGVIMLFVVGIWLWKFTICLIVLTLIWIAVFHFVVWLGSEGGVESIHNWLHKDKNSLTHIIAEGIEEFHCWG